MRSESEKAPESAFFSGKINKLKNHHLKDKNMLNYL